MYVVMYNSKLHLSMKFILRLMFGTIKRNATKQGRRKYFLNQFEFLKNLLFQTYMLQTHKLTKASIDYNKKPLGKDLINQ